MPSKEAEEQIPEGVSIQSRRKRKVKTAGKARFPPTDVKHQPSASGPHWFTTMLGWSCPEPSVNSGSSRATPVRDPGEPVSHSWPEAGTNHGQSMCTHFSQTQGHSFRKAWRLGFFLKEVYDGTGMSVTIAGWFR